MASLAAEETAKIQLRSEWRGHVSVWPAAGLPSVRPAVARTDASPLPSVKLVVERTDVSPLPSVRPVVERTDVSPLPS